MAGQEVYEPPLVWKWNPDNDQAFGNINRPTAGAQQQKELPGSARIMVGSALAVKLQRREKSRQSAAWCVPLVTAWGPG